MRNTHPVPVRCEEVPASDYQVLILPGSKFDILELIKMKPQRPEDQPCLDSQGFLE